MSIRRHCLKLLATLPLASVSGIARAASLDPTPQDVLGPYYPPSWPPASGNDLFIAGGEALRQGRMLALTGIVRSSSGDPLANARVEIWQTDHTGRYRHPGDDGEAPVQRGFLGFGYSLTDAAGRYRFRTMKPVAYSGRPAHIHFKVVAAGHQTLVTQMYFAGENKEPGFSFGFARDRDRLTVSPTAATDQPSGGLRAQFDLVLAGA